ncbi:hypothetical protein GOODEAATRI_008738 [Goodea atripinnis]|uniref:Zinc finger and BTB domain containing 33 n=1 Tax=Goodea atripinnis TaxID=208336 RepID=A0ABV0N912_9TELE
MPGLKLISATDTQYSVAVLKSLNEQRTNGLFCDITIIIQDKKFRAHKTILSASSTYFYQLFTVAGQVIELNFIRPEIFEHILNYIYSSKIVRVRSDMLEDLINAGKILGVKFIANLHLPLSQVKGLPGLSPEAENKSDASSEVMPVITESFSISAEEFNQTKRLGCSITPEPTSAFQSPENDDMLGVHKKKISSSSQQGDLKIRLLDVSEIAALPANNPKGTIEAKQTVTLDTGTKIDSLSSGCKVYANIGEDTYDIVQMNEDPGEGGSKPNKGKRALMATPTKSFDKSLLSPTLGPNKKKNKMELEDHYELIMDGKTFYVCAVCKRPYVCITSLRRHFNTHSWEKKYPCHFCNKVFALAEYRTKHEVTHTGERRYQCLLCNEMFLNYQILSNHCKQVHNQDASGRKQKDDGDNNLYRLLPCKSTKKKSWVTNLPGTPLISEDGSMQEMTSADVEDIHSSTQSRMLNWDDLFAEPNAHMRPDSHMQPISDMSSPPQGATEFEYITP